MARRLSLRSSPRTVLEAGRVRAQGIGRRSALLAPEVRRTALFRQRLRIRLSQPGHAARRARLRLAAPPLPFPQRRPRNNAAKRASRNHSGNQPSAISTGAFSPMTLLVLFLPSAMQRPFVRPAKKRSQSSPCRWTILPVYSPRVANGANG